VLYTFAETIARVGVRVGCGFIRAVETLGKMEKNEIAKTNIDGLI
jgi:hypothetical protein